MNIKVPRRLDFRSSAPLTKELSEVSSGSSVSIDFADMQFTEPLGMLMFSSAVRKLKNTIGAENVDACNFSSKEYPAHMGLFQSINVDFGKKVGEAKANVNYFPITRFTIYDWERLAEESGESISNFIERESDKLASVLSMGRRNIQETLSYSIRELIRNVFEHSASRFLWLCAQSWPAKDLVEVSLLDEGVGIATTLKRNPNIEISSDEGALRYAIEPGISGSAFLVNGIPNKVNGEAPSNSGFGLYVVRSLCNAGGSFGLVSGSAALYSERESIDVIPCSLSGTAVQLRLKPSSLKRLDTLLGALVKAGEEKAILSGAISVPTASKRM